VEAFLLGTGVIFLAELGDKSQLLALAFATRYRAAQVLFGITLATTLVHALSVVLGAAVGVALPTRTVAVLAGLAFVAFAAWTLRGDTLRANESARAARTNRSALVAVSIAFVLAELGDKTMLATVTLASREELFGTWAGSTLGMVAADTMAIGIGQQLGARLPDRAVRVGAAVAFVLFGALLVAEGLRG
jgi:putative Ca2+/H+ antiporter (TMEM165/GDT1 family)